MSRPDHVLGIYLGSHAAMIRILAKVGRVLPQESPDAVLVYADTSSSPAGALAAVKLHVSEAHVEDDLSSFNIAMPQEINRLLADSFSSGLLSPTCVGAHYLRRPGFSPGQIFPVGDMICNEALNFGPRVQASSGLMVRPGAAT